MRNVLNYRNCSKGIYVPQVEKEHIANREQIMYIEPIAIAKEGAPDATGACVVSLSNPGHKEHGT